MTVRDLLRRLAARIQFPVLGGVFVGRIKDRMLEEAVFHRRLPCPLGAANVSSLIAISMIFRDELRPVRRIRPAQIPI